MRYFFLALCCLLVMPASAQFTRLPGGVYPWSQLSAAQTQVNTRQHIARGQTSALHMLEIFIQRLLPGHKARQHKRHRDLEELIIVKEGHLKISQHGKSEIMGPGSIALTMPGNGHKIENVGQTSAAFYVFQYKSKGPSDPQRNRSSFKSFMFDWNQTDIYASAVRARRVFFDQPTATLDRFEMHVLAFNSGDASHAPHQHREEEFILVLKGDVVGQLEDNFFNAGAGDLIFLPANSLHSITNVGEGQAEYFAFKWR